jgi:hypothetical protein
MYQKYTPSCGSLLKVLVEQVDTKLQYIINKYKSDKWAKKISTRDQLEIMVSANLAQSRSLSDICVMVEGTKRFSCLSINKSSLSRVNENRDFHIFEDLYQNLLQRIRKRIGFSNLRIIDTTTETLSKILFKLWPYDKKHGAVRIGLEYDPNYELPDQIIISDGKMGDTTHGKKFKFRKNITYVLDSGFRDYKLFTQIIESEAFFIAGLHKTSTYELLKDREITQEDIISDQLVSLGYRKDYRRRSGMDKHPVRVIKFLDDHGEEMWLSTNRFDLTTREIRELYRRRWEIEIFFKFIKQNLKLKKFFGTSKNAIKIQIYTALIAYLLAYLLKPKWDKLTNFLRKIRYTLFMERYQLSFFDDS